MKNIFLLPTDEPSRLYEFGGEITLTDTPTSAFRNKNIYITSDEKIKEGDWFIDIELSAVKQCTDVHHKNGLPISNNTIYADLTNIKKIILATDPMLIADGVHRIDDKFLGWFANNPTCEFVKLFNSKWQLGKDEKDYYDIIIPKKEPLETKKAELVDYVPITKQHKLKESPPKDGLTTEYACGLSVFGSWASRLEQHEKYCQTKAGKYILKLEK